MDTNNWRPDAPPSGEPTENTPDWRTQMHPDSRQKVVGKIMSLLRQQVPASGEVQLNEMRSIAIRFEEKIYSSAKDQTDYMRKIALKLMAMENKSRAQNVMPNTSSNSKPPDPGSQNMLSQSHSQGQTLTLPGNQPQALQQLQSQNIQNNFASVGVQNSAGLPMTLPSVSGLTQNPTANVGQNPNMSNSASISQNTAGNAMGQSMQSNMFANPQRQMQGRQQLLPSQQQQQQQPQNQQQLHYQQLMKQKLQQGILPHSLMQSPLQQQQNLLQPTQLQSSQQSGMQTSPVMQPSAVQSSGQTMLQKHPGSLLRQPQQPQPASAINQQQAPPSQQSMMPQQYQQQQPQHLVGQQASASSMQHNQLIGQQNNFGDPQQQQQNSRTMLQQNQHQQQLMAQQNNLSNLHQPQSARNNFSGLQQQQLLGNPASNSSMQVTNQHSQQHMLPQSKVPLQQTQQSVPNLSSNQGQTSQIQAPPQQLMPRMQSQPTMQQQSNPFQQDMNPRLQASGSLLPQKNIGDQQNQLYQSQRGVPETSSTSLDSTAQTGHPNGSDVQEEVYQKIKPMKDMYFSELYEMHQKIAMKLQHDSMQQQSKPEHLDRFRRVKQMLEHSINFLSIPKESITVGLKEKLGLLEKQILQLLAINRTNRKLPGQSQLPQAQSHDNRMSPQLQSVNMQGSMQTMQQNMSSLQPCMTNSLQQSSNLDSGQGNALSSMHQNPVSTPQQPNMNHVQTNPNLLQSQHLKQEPQMLQTEQFKQQFQSRQMQQQYIQKQQLLQQQQLQQAARQQTPVQLQTRQMSQLQQMNDVNDMKMRQGMGVKAGSFQHHLPTGQRPAYPHQQLKPGSQFPISSPQLLQAVSPQTPQYSSPQFDQQNLLSSINKTGTPSQSANSPFVVPSPSTPQIPSPMPGNSEKPISGASSLSNTGNVGHQTSAAVQVGSQSVAVGTPGMSASPLLAEFTAGDGANGQVVSTVSGKSVVTEQPLDRLIKAVKSSTPKALSASVGDIGSVISMIDGIAGSAPGIGSTAAVGENLVDMTKCRLLAKASITQATKTKMRYKCALPLDPVTSAGSMNDSSKQLTSSESSDLVSTATSRVKRPRIEVNYALLDEIREINHRLIDTVVDINDEDVEPTAPEKDGGTVIKCSFSAASLCPNLKSLYASAFMPPIQPLRLLVPTNYPNCSPILLDKLPAEVSKEYEDFTVKAKSRFSVSLRSLPQPMSLGDMAKTWDVCARAVISEFAQQRGGGSFSSKYGSWKKCLSAAY